MTKITTSNPIEILRVGSFTDIRDREVLVTASDLAEMAANYDAINEPAPAVVGHPKTDDPAYGWAGKLSVVGDKLVAELAEVEPEFKALVDAGRFKRVSASFYTKADPNSPKPGQYYLKHIGFLGAKAPAVRGLKPVVQLSEGGDDAVTVEGDFAEIALSEPRDKLPPEKSPSQKEPVVAVKKTEDDPDVIALAEREAAISARETALDQRVADLQTKEAAIALAAAEAREVDAVAFAEGLVERMILPPAQKGRLVFVLKALGQADSAVCFGEGDDAEPADAAFKALFAGAVPPIALGEFARADKLPKSAITDPVELGEAASAYADEMRRKGVNISAIDAVAHIKKENL